jgi:hypothetical protein
MPSTASAPDAAEGVMTVGGGDIGGAGDAERADGSVAQGSHDL